jgi:hypothetical protein
MTPVSALAEVTQEKNKIRPASHIRRLMAELSSIPGGRFSLTTFRTARREPNLQVI